MDFNDSFDRLIGVEGGYSFHPDDPGGETQFGITYRVARSFGYHGDMRSLPRDTAKEIYRALYWDRCKCDELPDALRFDVFDAAVNSGAKQAVKWLQRIVGAIEDGMLGPVTLALVAKKNPVAVAAAMNGERLDLMTSLPTWGSFGKGWARRIASNLKSMPD
jgi:lysozyme family protein